MAPLRLSPNLTGDPMTLGPEAGSLDDLLRTLSLDLAEKPGVLQPVPAVALVHSLTGTGGSITLRWIHLPHAPVLLPGVSPAETAVLLTAPISESGRAIRLASRLIACLRIPGVLDRARGVTTREGLVKLFASVEETAGEGPLPAADLLALLGSRPMGLTAAEAERRREACGANRIERVRRRSLVLRFLEQFTSFFAILLWVGGALALLAGMPQLGWAIFIVIVINGSFSFFQEYRAERAVEALQELLPHEIIVFRDRAEARLPTVELVPGDLVRLEEGDQVPADGPLMSAEGLRVDQSALTGESHPVFKLAEIGDERDTVPHLERHELLFAGTGVVAGRGTCVVTATGMTTEIGTIAHLTQAVVEEPSPLQIEMVRVTRVVTLLAISFGIGFFLLFFP